jgi:hypothetical protein
MAGIGGLGVARYRSPQPALPGPGPHYKRHNQPRSVVVIGGLQFTPTEWSIRLSAYGDVDTCDITLPLSTTPDFGAKTTTGNSMPVAIYAGFPANPTVGSYSYKELSLRFAGVVDQFLPQADDDELKVSCRSNGALLADTKTTVRWQNQTTIQAIQQMAAEHGLTVVSQLRSGQTPAQMSLIWQRNFILANRDIYEWELIVAASLVDDVRVWVEGTTVFYVAPKASNQSGTDQYTKQMTVKWRRDLIKLGGQHSPQFSKNIQVEVRTWQPSQRLSTRVIGGLDANGNLNVKSKTISAVSQPIFGTRTVESSEVIVNSDGTVTPETATSTSIGGGSNTGFTTEPSSSLIERYIEHVSNMSRQDAINYAIAKWRQISAHTFNISLSRAMTKNALPKIGRNTIFQVTNHPWPSFNLGYHAMRIDENFSVARNPGGESAGWTFDLDGVNHVPQQQGV